MQGFEKILEHIKNEYEKECKEIAVTATEESRRISSTYSQKEQDVYWAYVNSGTKDIEKRVGNLANLAHEQARKLLNETEQNALDDVLALTAKKLYALPTQKYEELLTRLGVEQGCKPEYLVEQYRDELAPSVISALFDSVEHKP